MVFPHSACQGATAAAVRADVRASPVSQAPPTDHESCALSDQLLRPADPLLVAMMSLVERHGWTLPAWNPLLIGSVADQLMQPVAVLVHDHFCVNFDRSVLHAAGLPSEGSLFHANSSVDRASASRKTGIF